MMRSIEEQLARLGLDGADLKIRGLVGLAHARTETHTFDGRKLDVYERAVLELRVERDGRTVLELRPGSEPFAELAGTLARVIRLPLHDKRVEAGGPAPTDRREFSVPYAKVAILARADEDFIEALFSGDEGRIDEIAWVRFQQSDAFESQASTREEFLDLYREFRGSRYPQGMDFGDYYLWFRRSAKLLDADGNPTPEALRQANSMLDAWKDSEPGSNKYWLTRNLEVHPRHHAAFHALVDARAAASPDSGHGVGPRR